MPIGTVGKYERLDVLGHGTSGVVYLAWDTLLRRQVALKEIRADGPELERVLDEARVLDRLRHPNIVQVHGVDQADGVVLIDMELIRGRNLSQVLRDAGGGPLPLEQAAGIAESVLNALGYAHERRIVHRDVKPANILVGDNDVVKLTDFGLAEALGTGSVAGGGGTYPYMAPEDFAEDAATDYRSDLWAVGVVVYEMLAGRRPFVVAQRLKDPFAWKRVIEQEEPPRLSDLRPDLPPEVSEVVARALAKPKAARFPTAQVFADALRAAAAAPVPVQPLVIKASAPEVLTGEPEPEVPFIMGNGATLAYTLDDLLAGAAKHWDEARRALLDGRIERFLRAVGEVYIADLAAELAARGTAGGENPDRLLREFLNRSREEEEGEETGTLPLLGGANVSAGRPRRFRFAARRPTASEEADAARGTSPPSPPPVGTANTFATASAAPVLETEPSSVKAFSARAPYKPYRRGEPPAPTPEPARAEAPAKDAPAGGGLRHRWWFWPIYALTLAPPASAIAALRGHHFSQATRFHNLLEAWAVTGMLGAMLLLLALGVRLPGLARTICVLPIAAGVFAAGAMASQALGPQPSPDALLRVSIAALLPLGILLVQAATIGRQWRLWLVLTLIGAVLATAHFGRYL